MARRSSIAERRAARKKQRQEQEQRDRIVEAMQEDVTALEREGIEQFEDASVRAHVLSGAAIATRDLSDDGMHGIMRGQHVFETEDCLIREKGYRVFDRMLEQDADIKNAYWMKKSIRLSTGWSLDPCKPGSPLAEEMADFVQWNFDHFCEASIDTFLMKMWDGWRVGFKIAEMVWAVIPDGRYKGMIGLKDLIVRNSRHYSFKSKTKSGKLDPFGLVEGVSPTGVQIIQNPRRLPVKKFVIYSYNALDDNLSSKYGRPDFRVLWRYFYSQLMTHSTKLRAGETFSRPPLKVEVPDGCPKTLQTKILKDANSFYNRQATGFPAGTVVEAVESRRADSGLQGMLEYHGDQMSKGIGLGPVMAGNKERGVTVSKQQFDAFVFMLDWLGIDTASNIMNRPIISALINFNFEHTNLCPHFSMPKLSANRPLMGNFVKDMVEAGVIDPTEDWVRPMLDLPRQRSSQFNGFGDGKGDDDIDDILGGDDDGGDDDGGDERGGDKGKPTGKDKPSREDFVNPAEVEARNRTFRPPSSVSDQARMGLALRQQFGRGGNADSTWITPDLAKQTPVPWKTILRMIEFFEIHEADKELDGWQDRTNPSHEWITWLMYGGTPGWRWALRVFNENMDDMGTDGLPPNQGFAEIDAPNYRAVAPASMMKCSTCGFNTEGFCNLYKFFFQQNFTCDSWSRELKTSPTKPAEGSDSLTRVFQQVDGNWFIAGSANGLIDLGSAQPDDLESFEDDSGNFLYLIQERDNGDASVGFRVPRDKPMEKIERYARGIVSRRPDTKIILAEAVGRKGRSLVFRALSVFRNTTGGALGFRPV